MANPMLSHPPAEKLKAFGLGLLDAADSAPIESHLAECSSCQDLVEKIPPDELVGLLQAKMDTASSQQTLDSPSRSGNSSSSPDLPPELAAHPRYQVQELLGSGGMGAVFKAQHRFMERTVALKIINPALVLNPEAVGRFQREVKAAARLSHPNIVTAYDAETVGTAHFLAMEFVEGTTLAKLVEKEGPLPVHQACRYVLQAALGLQYAFEHGMVHRDIKPQNLMLTKKGSVKVLDFGLARFASESGPSQTMTQTGMMMGTPDYIAPEQAGDAHQADIRADIYSLGCTLYHLLTGRPPFYEGTAVQKLAAHLHQTPLPINRLRPEMPSELARIVERMMAKDPAKRFQTPAEVAKALTSFSKPRPVNPRKKWPLWVGAAAALLILAVAGIVFFWRTPHGIVRIECDDPKVEIVFDNTGPTIKGVDREPISLRPGEHGLLVKRGNFLFETDKLLIKRGETVTLKIELVKGQIQISKDGQLIAGAPFGKEIPPVAVTIANAFWRTKGQELVQTTNVRDARIYFGDLDWTDYDFSAEVMRTGGNDGLCLLARVTDEHHFHEAIFGAWDNKEHMFRRVEYIKEPARDKKPAVEFEKETELANRVKGSLKLHQWHKLRVSVRGKHIRAFLDDGQVFTVMAEDSPKGAVGLRTFAPFRLRAIQVTDPAGRVLFAGPPRLPVEPEIAKSAIPVSGEKTPGVDRLDAILVKAMDPNQAGCAALAVGHKGQILYSRGYGWLDKKRLRPAPPDSLIGLHPDFWDFLTATAVKHLARAGKLRLDDKLLALLPVQGPEKLGTPRLRDLTLEHLLQHKAGWGPDPTVAAIKLARQRKLPEPLGLETLLGIVMTQPLGHGPGEKEEYCAFDFAILRHLVAKVSKGSFEDYLRKELFRPLVVKDLMEARPNLPDDPRSAWNAGVPGLPLRASAPALVPFIAHYFVWGDPRTFGWSGMVRHDGEYNTCVDLHGRDDHLEFVVMFNHRPRHFAWHDEINQALDRIKRIWVVGRNLPAGKENGKPDEKQSSVPDPARAAQLIGQANGFFDKKQYARGVKAYTEALGLDPDNPNILRLRGWTYWNDGKPQQAIADASEALRRRPTDIWTLRDRSYYYLSTGAFLKCMDDAGAILEIDPSFAIAFYYRGMAMAMLGNYPQALADLDEALRLDNKYAQAFLYRGIVHEKMGHRDQARADRDQADKLDPGISGRGFHLNDPPSLATETVGQVRLFQGTSQINSGVLFANDRLVLSGDNDGKARIWDVFTGKKLFLLRDHEEFVWAVAVSPDGRLAASAGGGKTENGTFKLGSDFAIRIWDMGSRKLLRRLTGHANWIQALVFSPDGKKLLSVGLEGNLRLWNVDTGDKVLELPCNVQGLCMPAFSPDGKKVLTAGGSDQTMDLWDLGTGKKERTFAGHKGAVSGVALSPDRKLALSASYDKTVCLWDIASGQKRFTFSEPQAIVNCVIFSPDGRWAIAGVGGMAIPGGAKPGGNDNSIYIWDVKTGRLAVQFKGHTGSVMSLAVARDSRHLLSTSYDGTMRWWRLPELTR